MRFDRLQGSPAKRTLVLVGAIVVLSTIAGRIATPLLPLYAQQLKATPNQIGFLLAVYGFTQFFTQPPLGIVADKVGHHKLIQGMLILYSLTGLGYGLSSSLEGLIVFRCLQAIAAGGLSVSIRSLITAVTTEQNRGQINGITSSLQNIGTTLGPALGSILADLWHVSIPFYLIAFVATLCYIFSFQLPNIQTNFGTPQKIYSLKTRWPRSLLLVGFVHLVEFMGLGIWLTVWPIYAVDNLGWSVSAVGISYSVSAATSIISAPLWGKISDQFGRTISALLGLFFLLCQPLAVLLFPQIPALIWISMAVAGVGATGYFNAYFTLSGDLVPYGQAGWFFGVLTSANQLGASVGSVLAPYLWQWVSIQFAIASDVFLLILCVLLYIPLYYKEMRGWSPSPPQTH